MKHLKRAFIIPLRFIVQVIFFIAEWLTTIADRIALVLISLFYKSQYIRVGKCQRTGQCCLKIGMHLPKSWAKKQWIVNLVSKWHHLHYNFEKLGVVDNVIVYRCLYLTKNKTCPIHFFKPRLCREFPPRKFVGKADLYEGCGFSYVPRKSLGFERVLKEAQNKHKAFGLRMNVKDVEKDAG